MEDWQLQSHETIADAMGAAAKRTILELVREVRALQARVYELEAQRGR